MRQLFIDAARDLQNIQGSSRVTTPVSTDVAAGARMGEFKPADLEPPDLPDPDQDHGTGKVSILLVEDDGIVAADMEESLRCLGYEVLGVATEGLQAVRTAEALRPDLIVMDVSLRGDIDGIQAATMIQDRARVPVIFLTGHRDSATLQRAVATGPLGYIVKPFQEVELRCAIEVAIHKHRADLAMREREEALRRNAELLASLSLIDELTQLRNRRGFYEVSRQALKIARREHHAMALFFIDLDGLKLINDTHGHLAGDQSLRDAAFVLRQTFREADVLGRIGGDEFVALAHVNEDAQPIVDRMQTNLRAFNATHKRPFALRFSVGAALLNLTDDDDIESLIARADAAMYEARRAAAASGN